MSYKPQLVCLAIVLGFLLPTTSTQSCNIPGQAGWQQVDIQADLRPQMLAMDAMRDYTRGLEETAADVSCPWSDGVEDGATIVVQSACKPDPASQQYAIRFSYSVSCFVVANFDNEGAAEPEKFNLTGVVEGILPAEEYGMDGKNGPPIATTRAMLFGAPLN